MGGTCLENRPFKRFRVLRRLRIRSRRFDLSTDIVEAYFKSRAGHRGIKAARAQYDAWLAIAGAANTGTYVIAIDEGSGSTLWQQSVSSGTGSTPAVTCQGVNIAVPCGTVGFALLTGTSLFADSGGCEGGGGTTAVVANNVFYSLMGEPANGIYVNATTGAQLGTFMADVVPAIGPTSGFFLKSGTLNAKSLSDNSALWSFQRDGGLVSSPIIVNQAVIVGSSSGQLYGSTRQLARNSGRRSRRRHAVDESVTDCQIVPPEIAASSRFNMTDAAASERHCNSGFRTARGLRGRRCV
jgi:hypothetical protein